MATKQSTEHLDVIIVGAGLSGISGAYYVQTKCPTKSYAVLEGRSALGGTWDLFRYPGVRSDSDMHTLGYGFHPWSDPQAIADGPSILSYIEETAAEFDIDSHIRFNHKVKRASWSSADALWTVEAERSSDEGPANGDETELVRFTCNFLYMCSGYYSYKEGHMPDWPGAEQFVGRIVHPQQWPQDLDYANKRIVVIGSGATAVTLIPAMADDAAHVTMLQRSPSYIAAKPSEDAVANWLARRFPDGMARWLTRWKYILEGIYYYQFARRLPGVTKNAMIKFVQEALGPDYDVDKHFTPTYNPWDQRVCLVPNGDLFKAIKSGKASVATDHIESFTEGGIRLQSGEELEADIVVAATGLKVQLMGGMQLVVDGRPVELAETMSYKGMMYSDVPNLASAFGYTNSSWTLKCELIAQYACRLINYMDRCGYDQCTPRREGQSLSERPAVDLSSGYIQRAVNALPRQSDKKPWKINQNYLLDLVDLRMSGVNDGAMEFRRRGEGTQQAERLAEVEHSVEHANGKRVAA